MTRNVAEVESAPESADPTSAGKRPRHRAKTSLFEVIMQAPSLIVLAVIIAVPLGISVALSFQAYSPVIPNADGQWVGFANYLRLFTDAQFGRAILLTFVFAVLAVGMETVLGILLGIYLNSLAASRRVITSLLMLPMITTPLVVGLIFSFALNAEFGYISPLLRTLGIAPEGGMLTDPTGAFVALVLTDVWEWTPFIALMVMAGLSAMPQAPIEAAMIDGASWWQMQWQVKLPMIRAVIGVAILFRLTEAIREFDKVFILTGGGPGAATTVTDLYQYRIAFTNWDLSYGAALGMVSFIAVLIASVFMFRVLARMTKETS